MPRQLLHSGFGLRIMASHKVGEPLALDLAFVHGAGENGVECLHHVGTGKLLLKLFRGAGDVARSQRELGREHISGVHHRLAVSGGADGGGDLVEGTKGTVKMMTSLKTTSSFTLNGSSPVVVTL